MLTNISKLQVQVDNKAYQFLCDVDSPLASVKEALFQFSKYVGSIEDQVKANQEAQAKQAAESAPAPIVPVEEKPKEVEP